jgi:sterol desaturase/sphingolipid hydroxylase (fatty acid hydroxylase superfamily)
MVGGAERHVTADPAAVAAVALFFVVLFLAERAVPLRPETRPLAARLAINAAIGVLAFIAAVFLVRPAALAVLDLTSSSGIGLLHLIAMPVPLQFVVAILLFDLTFYWWHVATHRVGWIWRFHRVHHIDPDLDASTAFRFHAGEIAISTVFRVVQVAVIGPSLAMFAAYEVIFQAATIFHHSNVRLPERLERVINAVVVTPRMHGTHHSQVPEETNSNFSVVFSWWDRLHRSRRPYVPSSELAIGVAEFNRPEDNGLGRVLALPFRPSGTD